VEPPRFHERSAARSVSPLLSRGSTAVDAGHSAAALNAATVETGRSAGDEARIRDPYLGKVRLQFRIRED
jgi:hypothetical protein